MKKTIIVHGLIAGLIISLLMLFMLLYLSYCSGNVDYGTSMLIGYASMLLAFSLVFVGIRNYRDKYNGGVISFGKAFKVGILMVLIASTIYAIVWLIDYYVFVPDFFENYAAHTLAELKASGASKKEIAEQTKDMAEMITMLKNPIINALMAYMEILPVGLVVTIISSLVLKRRTAKAEAIG